MAHNQISDITGVVDIRRTVKAGDTTTHMGTIANYTSVSAMRTRLAAINGAYYTAYRLDQMNQNDMLYAIRVADDPGSIR